MRPSFRLAGKPQLLIVDGGGTLFDPGSVVPIIPFQESFQNALAEDGKPYGIIVKSDIVMKYMGRSKLEHIKTIFENPEIIEQFEKRFRRAPSNNDYHRIYEVFKEKLYPSASRNEEIPGVKEAAYKLKERRIPMVMTTGYDRRMIDRIRRTLPWLDDVLFDSIAATDIKKLRGRPAPFMIYRALESAGVENPAYALNVGDTEYDTLSADNASMPSIIVTSGVLKTRQEAEDINSKIGRKHLILDSLADAINFTLDGTLADRIKSA